ncbi:MAG: PQQ-like beta-propeller repeat protein [Acidobacteria bacterium]|nr:PQQ-like beta-propeller repeat protein [Acidobacteriota bacterium]
MRSLFVKTALCASVVVSCCSAAAAQAGEWSQWRGPNRDGVSKETGLLKQWAAEGPPLVWKAQGAGAGYSSLAVTNGRIYTMGLRGDREYVIAFDAAPGKEVWATPHGTAYRDSRGDGPRGTPTVDGDRLYALGGSGDLSALEAKTGKVVWTMNVLKKFGGENIGGYSSAITVEVGGKQQVVFFTSRRAIGLGLSDGKLLWEYDRPSNRTANVATPVARGNRVFISSDYGTGAGLVEIKADARGATVAQEIYFTKEMRNHHSSSILVGDHLYGFSSGILTAMRFDTGEVAWRDRSVGKGSLVYADGMLYAFSENGVVGLVEATPAGYSEKGRFRIQQGSLPTWTHPVIAGGRLYLRDQDMIYAYDVRQKK